MPTPLNIYLVEKHRKKLARKKRERVRVKGQESHNRRVGNPPNSLLSLQSRELSSHSTYFDKFYSSLIRITDLFLFLPLLCSH